MNGSWTFIMMVLAIISVYSLLNYYFIRKHRHAVTLKSLPGILARLILITLIFTPVATVIFSQHGPPFMAAVTGFTGYSWLAFLFLFLVIHGSADIALCVAQKAGFTPRPTLHRAIFMVTLVLSLSILFYGRYEAAQIITERLEIKTAKLPVSTPSFTILQLSDIHFSPITGVTTARRLLNIVQREKPDLIVITGDLLDRGVIAPGKIQALLNQMSAPAGKYAITGNHEFFAGIKESSAFIRKAGFHLLRNESVTIDDFITVIGVDDPTVRRFEPSWDIPEKELLQGADPKRFVLLLKHQPRIDPEGPYLFDLQLSGHTHAGQIFPFTILVKIAFPYLCGWYELDERGSLYVSRGTGTWGPPFRFLAPPEVTLITLLRVE